MERNLHATRLGDETYSFGIVSGLNQPVGTNVNEAWRILLTAGGARPMTWIASR
jgi:hypothetical protein